MNKDFTVNLIGIGAAKCGTSSLAHFLQQHPDICFSMKKEVNFFNAQSSWGLENDAFEKGLEHYRSFWPRKITGKICAEYSPSYLFDDKAAKRIHDTFPDARLMAIFRNPLDMVYSRYWFNRAFHRRIPQHMTFEEAIEKIPRLLEGALFSKQLKRYLDLFPREQIKIFLLEDLKADPARIAKEAYRHAGVDDSSTPDFTPVNESKQVRSLFLRSLFTNLVDKPASFTYQSIPTRWKDALKKSRLTRTYELTREGFTNWNVERIKKPTMEQETRKKLQEYFREDIDKLEQLISRDLSSWK